VAGNALWALVFPDIASLSRRERNMVRWTLLDPRARLVWWDWERVARDYVHVLRLAAADQPRNQRIATPPVHLLLGSDALRLVTAGRQLVQNDIDTWKDLSLSTDRPDGGVTVSS